MYTPVNGAAVPDLSQKNSLVWNFTPYFHDCKKLLLSFEFYSLFSRARGKLLFWKNPSEGSAERSTDICAIHGFLRRVWIHRLRKQIHGYRRSTDCAQHVHLQDDCSRVTKRFSGGSFAFKYVKCLINNDDFIVSLSSRYFAITNVLHTNARQTVLKCTTNYLKKKKN